VLPQVSAAVLSSKAALLIDIFEHSMDVSDEDLIAPPRRSSRLVKTPTAKGKRRSARKKRKAVVDESTDGGSCGDSENEYRTPNDSNEQGESNDKAGLSKSNKHTGVDGESSPTPEPPSKKAR
jgi:hypothetical protein